MLRHALALGLALFATAPALQAQQARQPSRCIANADAEPGLQYLHKAAWTDPVPEYSVRIRYLSHASFLDRRAHV